MDLALPELQAAFDERGLFRMGELPIPRAEDAYLVFAQAADARVDAEALTRAAAQFFGSRLGLLVPKRYAGLPSFPREDGAVFLVGPAEGRAEPCFAYGRARTKDDIEHAERAELAVGGGGLALLAQRCRFVWVVDRRAAAPRAPLLLAAVLATVLLGPIVAAREAEIFGVRTARSKLEGLGAPYRD